MHDARHDGFKKKKDEILLIIYLILCKKGYIKYLKQNLYRVK